MGSDLSVNPPIYRTPQPATESRYPQSGECNPMMKNGVEPHFTIRTDHYATGDGGQQTITQVESAPIRIGRTKVTVGVGQDIRQDRTPGQDPTVVDFNVRQPIIDYVELRGRVRTSIHPGKTSSQARVGVQATVPVTQNGSVYAQVYGADRVYEGGRTSGLRAGAFVGYQYQFTDRLSGYVEGQAYDLGHWDRDTLGVNAGLKCTF